jgi:hypothetical protein
LIVILPLLWLLRNMWRKYRKGALIARLRISHRLPFNKFTESWSDWQRSVAGVKKQIT